MPTTSVADKKVIEGSSLDESIREGTRVSAAVIACLSENVIVKHDFSMNINICDGICTV